MDTRIFTLVEMEQMTGAKRRAIQFWSDAGVLETTSDTAHAGRGVHRHYTVSEAQVAAILAPLGVMGTPVGVLKAFAHILRWAIAEKRARGPHKRLRGGPKAFQDAVDMLGGPEIGDAIARAARGEGHNFLVVAHSSDKIWFHAAMDSDGPITIDPIKDLPQLKDQTDDVIIIIDLTKRLKSFAG